MPSPTLYQLDEALLSVLNTLEQNGGELTPEMEAILSLDGKAFESKAAGYLHLIATFEADVEFCAKEAARITARKKTLEGNIARMKERLAHAVELRGGKGVRVETYALSSRWHESVEITDEEKLPVAFTKEVRERVPVKDAIKAALQLGHVVTGAQLKKKISLTIR